MTLYISFQKPKWSYTVTTAAGRLVAEGFKSRRQDAVRAATTRGVAWLASQKVR